MKATLPCITAVSMAMKILPYVWVRAEGSHVEAASLDAGVEEEGEVQGHLPWRHSAGWHGSQPLQQTEVTQTAGNLAKVDPLAWATDALSIPWRGILGSGQQPDQCAGPVVAFEDNLKTLQTLTIAIRNFSKEHTLKKTTSRDNSLLVGENSQDIRARISEPRYQSQDITARRISEPGYHSQDITARISEPGYHSQDITARISEPGYQSQDIRARISEPGYQSQGIRAKICQ
ncbi:hypothetical protein ACOMHN_032915 [Nucella lapillus]